MLGAVGKSIWISVLLICPLVITSCYRHSSGYRTDGSHYRSEEEAYSGGRSGERSFDSPGIGEDRDIEISPSRLPWEAWPFGLTFKGTPLRNVYLLKGDELLKGGFRKSALEEYLKANSFPLSQEEQEAWVVRVASTQLTLDQPQQALNGLTSYFKKQKLSVEEVNSHFSLLFAYSYGRINNIEQSLAWFSRINRIEAGRGGMVGTAESGVRSLVRSIPKDDFYPLLSSWSSDSFISGVLGQEARRRTLSGEEEPSGFDYGNIWASESSSQPFESEALAGQAAIGVLLPFSGKYAALGKSVKNGIKLAFSSHKNMISLQTKDTAGDAYQAAALVQQIERGKEPEVLMGPLLAAPVRAVSDIARRRKIPMLALSKTSSLVTGDTVFRLGPTPQSQVRSLLAAVSSKRGLNKFALLFPETEAGYEYSKVFRKEVNDLGLHLTFEQGYSAGGEADYFPIIGESLEASKTQAVFIADDLSMVTRFRISISEELKNRLTILGPARWYNLTELKRSRSVLEGIVFVSPFFQESERSYIKQFIRTYQHRYKTEPNFLAAQGFDAAAMVLAALQRRDSTGSSFPEALFEIETYQGLTGLISVSPSGEMIRQFAVVQLQPQGLAELQERKARVFRMRGNSEF